MKLFKKLFCRHNFSLKATYHMDKNKMYVHQCSKCEKEKGTTL